MFLNKISSLDCTKKRFSIIASFGEFYKNPGAVFKCYGKTRLNREKVLHPRYKFLILFNYTAQNTIL